jgi:polyvinyl alcohol dehydrogenase (cytochrome)
LLIGAAACRLPRMKLCLPALTLVAAIAVGSPVFAQTAAGAAGYKKYCAACHDQVTPRIPGRDVLQKMPATRILRTLNFGLMMSIAYPMRLAERQAVADYLGTKDRESGPPKAAFCAAAKHPMSGASVGNWAGWSPLSDNRRFQADQDAALSPSRVSHLTLKWAFGFPSDVIAIAAPAVVNGTLFVGSAAGTVYALDAKTGCLHWLFQANGPVRSTTVPVRTGSGYSLIFGDQIGWVYSIDANTGRLKWKKRFETHEATRLTGAPAVFNGMVFIPAASWEETRAIDPQYVCCTFRGSVTAVRASDGALVWKTYLVDQPKKTGVSKTGVDQMGPSGAGVWSAPTVDDKRGVLYITTGDNYSHPATPTSDAVIALDLKSGRIVWTQQTIANDVYTSACGSGGVNCPTANGPDYDFGSPAQLIKDVQGRELLVAGQKSGVVYALDPDQKGKVVWQARVGKGSTNGGVQWGMASDGNNVYAAVSDVVRPPGGIGGAAPIGNARLDPVQGGGLTALRLTDGTRVWFVPGKPCEPPRPGCSPAQPAAVTAIPGVVFSGAMDGHLRAFATANGSVLWDVDTARPFETVNGGKAVGGSLDGAGPIVSSGMVFVNSGYPRFGGMPGNVLLAFGAP